MHRYQNRFALLALLGLTGCSVAYCDENAFSRDASLFAGEIHGRAMLEDSTGTLAAVPFAQVKVRGTGQFHRADSEGNFVVWDLEAGSWVLQVTSDDDGDGLPDRRRILTSILREAPHRRQAEFVPGLAEQPEELTGVDVGQIVLEGTAEVGGKVLLTPPGGGDPRPPSELGRNVVVLAGRNFDLPKLTEDGFDPVSLGAEARTHVDDQGLFLLRNLGAGSFYLVVLVFDQVADISDPARLRRVSPQVFVRAFPDGSTELAEPIVLPAADAPAQVATASMLVTPPVSPDDEVYLLLVPPGRELPSCEFPAPNFSQIALFSYVRQTAPRPGGVIVTFNDAPVGSWDIKVCSSSGDAGDEGLLYDEAVQVLEPGVVSPLLGPVLLGAPADPCLRARRCHTDADCGGDLVCGGDVGAERCETANGQPLYDCDGDGRRGLPRLVGENDPNKSIWDACDADCAASLGGSVGDVTCDVDGETFDCDDDGDGQADVTEKPQCYGLGKGGDADSDGLCDPVDAFPRCKANTAAQCEAGGSDVPQSQYGGGSGNVALCAVAQGAPSLGEDGRYSEYCTLTGTEVQGSVCAGYSMVCTLVDDSGAVTDTHHRQCITDADCGLGTGGNYFSTSTCNARGLCEYQINESFVDVTTTCESVDGTSPCPAFFDCEERAGDPASLFVCIGQDAPPARASCTCTSPGEFAGEPVLSEQITLSGNTCVLDKPDTQTLWQTVCGFPSLSGTGTGNPTPTTDAGPGGTVALDGGGNTGPVDGCAPASSTATCTNGLIPDEISYCNAELGAYTTEDCGTYLASCGPIPCASGACGTGDICLARSAGIPCNIYDDAPPGPKVACANGNSCEHRFQSDSSNEQTCRAPSASCTDGVTSLTCAGNVLEVCSPILDSWPEAPFRFDCAAAGGSCSEYMGSGTFLCQGADGAICDPAFNPLDPTVGALPYFCAAGLTCIDGGNGLGTCGTTGGISFDAGPDAGVAP